MLKGPMMETILFTTPNGIIIRTCYYYITIAMSIDGIRWLSIFLISNSCRNF